MSVFDRILNLTKATANEMLNKMENPTLMMNQYIRNMEEEIDGMKSELHRQQAASRSYGSRLEEVTQLAQHNQAKAEEALREGREAEARAALEAKLRYSDQEQEYRRLHEQAKHASVELEIRLDSAKEELQRLIQKRNELSERIQKAEAAAERTAPSFSHGFEPGRASRGFERIEEKVLQWEAQLGLSRDYKGPSASSSSYAGGYEAAPSAAPDNGRSAAIDEQLADLRRKMKGE
ncbi:PspA/IM30 family protein [Paenibacillus pasadenensis]|uniref:Phage shock protein A n=1 Tax=Paenibacillus pasadenensis TaxID=217090 RepID=A0A2N5N0Y9_9BACL|nr:MULTISPECIES: PspA/IM30 family protein [Paenibacillus]PLT44008.1 Phage shock protein A [Paenibacillus pasadenensis]QGG54567.1 PspA/IM30 family protein [Paenibacillus sp. B01]